MANGHQYKLKDKKIQLYTFTTSKVNGVSVKEWKKTTPNKIWAYYRLNTGNVQVNNGALVWVNAVENVVFVINRHSEIEITTKNRIVFNHKIYNITLVDDYEGYLTDLKINATLADDQTFNSGDNKGILDD